MANDNFKTFDTVDMAATAQSKSMNTINKRVVSFGLVWTGTPTGTLDLEVSNDDVNWFPLGMTLAAQPAGGASSTGASADIGGWGYVRVAYTRSSGTGTLSISSGSAS